MRQLNDAIIQFLQKQGCVIVSSIDSKGFPHSSCKDIIKIDREGRVYLLDAYQGETLGNLTRNPAANITAFDEHKFMGYCLKGKAKVISKEDLSDEVIQAWEARIANRVAGRLLKNIRMEKADLNHPEVSLPGPSHMIILEVEEVVDLEPRDLRKAI